MSEKKRLLFVCQRYGREINGGAEMECRAYAEHLAGNYAVEVLTTCAVDYVLWKNEYPAGDSEINGVLVHRFRNTEERDQKEFAELSKVVYMPGHTDEEERRWIQAQGPVCPDAIDYLRRHAQEYHAVLFMTYLYYLTACGLVPNMKNAILIPTAHDEPPVHLRYFDSVFQAAQGIIYNTEEEKNFVERRFPATQGKPSCTVGYGIDPISEQLPDVRTKFSVKEQYLLYAGRIDESKGCGAMFAYFLEYKKQHPSGLKLLLIGKAAMPIPQDPDICALGFVSDEEKYALMKNARMLVLASPFESLSIVVLESMMAGTPVLVNGACAVLKGHCIHSNAGLYFTDYTEFAMEIEYLEHHPEVYAQMQKNGKEYVCRQYQWPHIVAEMEKLIERVAAE